MNECHTLCDRSSSVAPYCALMAQSEMPKSEFLQIRLTPKDKERIEAAAAAEHLDPSTWARRVLLISLEQQKKAGRQERK